MKELGIVDQREGQLKSIASSLGSKSFCRVDVKG